MNKIFTKFLFIIFAFLLSNKMMFAQPSPKIDVLYAIEFDHVYLGASKDETFKIANKGDAPLIINGVEIAGETPEHFTILGATFPVTILAGASKDFTVRFEPIDLNLINANLRIDHNVPSQSPTIIWLGGLGYVDRSVLPSNDNDIDFGAVQVGSQKDTVINLLYSVPNPGKIEYIDVRINIIGPDESSFIATTPDGSPITTTPQSITVKLGETIKIPVSFKPTSMDTQSSYLFFNLGDGPLVDDRTLVGEGVNLP